MGKPFVFDKCFFCFFNCKCDNYFVLLNCHGKSGAVTGFFKTSL